MRVPERAVVNVPIRPERIERFDAERAEMALVHVTTTSSRALAQPQCQGNWSSWRAKKAILLIDIYRRL
jgi:hypothetical protein